MQDMDFTEMEDCFSFGLKLNKERLTYKHMSRQNPLRKLPTLLMLRWNSLLGCLGLNWKMMNTRF